ncbi:hypothetical protein HYW58_01320 [Candidatus Kaiserbacteria bacterium]|nr:hypothetical protein [Candidatus Kaiserbacteria bacterium]
MKHTRAVHYTIIMKGILAACIIFLLSLSFALAQTETEVRNVQGEAEPKTVRPETFIDKARDVLLKNREESEKLRAREERGRDTEVASQKRADEARDKRIERIDSYLERISRKMTAAVERLDKLSDRIESRINKLEARGVDMAKARELLETARVHITEAGESLKTALSEAKEALAGDISRDAFGKMASTLAHAKEKLRDAHQALVEVIRTMKAGLEQNEREAQENDGTEN